MGRRQPCAPAGAREETPAGLKHQPEGQHVHREHPNGKVHGQPSAGAYAQFWRRKGDSAEGKLEQVHHPGHAINQAGKHAKDARQMIALQHVIERGENAELFSAGAGGKKVAGAPFEIEEPRGTDQQGQGRAQRKVAREAALDDEFQNAENDREDDPFRAGENHQAENHSHPGLPPGAIQQQGGHAEGQEEGGLHAVEREPQHVPAERKKQRGRQRLPAGPDGIQQRENAGADHNQRGNAQ